ncbi:MAG TPA: S41 family peptidase [Candidatus Aminicenantes bacterium]|nr:S41 family peptidase [Candidatus Aminicenantes bacterium]HRY65886.1 S41 family peptidase [Candidatus Aminicenantes bacterium]HRZ72788.1 S41 family peptidase [Candidatus Aminicenantes bacterium]
MALILITAPVPGVPEVPGQAGAPPGPPAAIFDPARTFSPDKLKTDLRLLWDILEEGHGGLDRYAPADSLRKMFEEARSGLTGPLTEIGFYARLLPLVAAIEDGHTRLALSPGAAAYLDSRPVHFPFELRFVGDRACILRNLSGNEAAGPGAEILAIDGRPIKEVLAALLPLVPADAGIRTARLRRLEDPAEFGRLYAVRFGMPGSFRTRVRPLRSREAGEIEVAGITAAENADLLRRRYPETAGRRPSYELAFRDATAVLTIRQFADDPAGSRPAFPDFLTDTFRTLEAKKTPCLVIDLRANGGGFDEYAKMLFAHVMDRPFLYYWSIEAKKDRYDFFRYTGETGESAEELARPLRRNDRGRFDVAGHPNSGLQMPRAPRFAGPVALLVDGGTRSAAGEAVSAFHYYKKAVFFGQECGAGYYGNTAYLVTAALPATGLRIRLPLVLTVMAVDGYPKDRGLVPDFPVAPSIEDLLDGRDPVLERALAYLKKR